MASSKQDITIGLTKNTHKILQDLKEDGVFREMVHGYRFGIALAIARGKIMPDDIKINKTIFNKGTLDKDDSIKNIIVELYPESEDRPYRHAERLAEWGVREMGQLHLANELRFGDFAAKLLGSSSGESPS